MNANRSGKDADRLYVSTDASEAEVAREIKKQMKDAGVPANSAKVRKLAKEALKNAKKRKGS